MSKDFTGETLLLFYTTGFFFLRFFTDFSPLKTLLEIHYVGFHF